MAGAIKRRDEDRRRLKWIDSVSEPHASTIRELKRQFLSGVLPLSARGLARSIIENLQGHAGTITPSLETVRVWLAEK